MSQLTNISQFYKNHKNGSNSKVFILLFFSLKTDCGENCDFTMLGKEHYRNIPFETTSNGKKSR